MRKYFHYLMLLVLGLIAIQFASCSDDDNTQPAPQIKDMTLAQLHDTIEGLYVDTTEINEQLGFVSLKLEKEKATSTYFGDIDLDNQLDTIELSGTWRILDLCDIITDDNNRIVPIELEGDAKTLLSEDVLDQLGFAKGETMVRDTMLAIVSAKGNVCFICSDDMGEFGDLSDATTIGQLLNDMNSEGPTRGVWSTIVSGVKSLGDKIVEIVENTDKDTVKKACVSFLKTTAGGFVAYAKMIQEVFASGSIDTPANFNDWMSNIKEDVPVSFVSIPGTHDSFTASIMEWRLPWGKTQKFGPEDLWARGCRQFDIRLSYHWNRTGDDKLEIIHDSESLLCNWTAKRAFDAITSLLSKYKDETVVVVVKFDFVQDGKKLEADTYLHNFLMENYGTQIAKFYPGITMKEARGKMIIIDRTGKMEQDKVQIIPGKDDKIASLDGDWGNNKYSSFYYDYDKNDGKLIIQDKYGMDAIETLQTWIDKKWEFITDCFDMSANDNHAWVFNHTSGYTFGAISNYYNIVPSAKFATVMSYSQNAYYTNDNTNTYLQKNTGKHIGIIVMDFLGTESEWFGHCPYGKVLPVTVIYHNKTLMYNGEPIWRE